MGTSNKWITSSAGALRISRAVMVVAGCGLTVTVVLGLGDLVRQRPVHGLDWLLIPAVPAIAFGHVWGIAVLLARRPRDVQRSWFSWTVSSSGGTDPRRFFFDGLPKRQANTLLALAGLGWVSAMTAAVFGGFNDGGPTSGTPGCPYRLDNHGFYSCVSRATYEHAGAATQRFACGILAGFFVLHLGMAAAELARRAP